MKALRLRVVDYVANLGGGVRFAAEMLRALLAQGGLEVSVASHGPGLRRYQEMLGAESAVRFVDLAPRNPVLSRTLMAGIPGAGPLNWLLRTPRSFEIPESVFENCDVVWLPWSHRHRLHSPFRRRVVVSLHDIIMLEFPGLAPRALAADEKRSQGSWLESKAEVVVSSNATVAALNRVYGVDRARLRVIPLSGRHEGPKRGTVPGAFPFSGMRFIFGPANTTIHKNHEVLLAGVGAWGGRVPLVLTGEGTDLWASGFSRRRYALRRGASKAGLVREQTLFGLGYVDDATYFELLRQAWAVVMPTLAEGGGSFPVLEAMQSGVPVVCSDIPVMQEMVSNTGGQVIWFDPRRPADLADKLRELEKNYVRYRDIAQRQVRELRPRMWSDVASEYRPLFNGA